MLIMVILQVTSAFTETTFTFSEVNFEEGSGTERLIGLLMNEQTEKLNREQIVEDSLKASDR